MGLTLFSLGLAAVIKYEYSWLLLPYISRTLGYNYYIIIKLLCTLIIIGRSYRCEAFARRLEQYEVDLVQPCDEYPLRWILEAGPVTPA